ncbi:MAG: esterase family protein [Anaerolineales bacterium]|nr:esterase family protein [Anaerolineales bacterium]
MNEVGLITAVLTLLIIFFTVWARWQRQKCVETVTCVTLPAFPSRHLGNVRDISLFLPPGYTATNGAYPVLYLNDGQDVMPLRLRETMAALIARGKIAPLIVVAIPTNEDRLHEYGTAVTINAQGLGSKASAYTKFIIEELMPHINQTLPVSRQPAHTAFLGMSLGGLSAFDIAWNYPHLFGTVGVFSGSFWWRAGADDPYVTPGKLIAHELVRNGRYHPGQRFWFEAATQDETDDRDGDGIIDAIQDTLELMDALAQIGYKRGQEMVYAEIRGGRHNYDTWAEVLPDFLTWAFARKR